MAETACRLLFGQVEGELLHRRVERAIGRQCPCFSTGSCPMLRPDGSSPLLDITADVIVPPHRDVA